MLAGSRIAACRVMCPRPREVVGFSFWRVLTGCTSTTWRWRPSRRWCGPDSPRGADRGPRLGARRATLDVRRSNERGAPLRPAPGFDRGRRRDYYTHRSKTRARALARIAGNDLATRRIWPFGPTERTHVKGAGDDCESQDSGNRCCRRRGVPPTRRSAPRTGRSPPTYRQAVLTEPEQLEEVTLKKRKLQLKDRMEILRRHREGDAAESAGMPSAHNGAGAQPHARS